MNDKTGGPASDRELLEMAAKAAGIKWVGHTATGLARSKNGACMTHPWEPLTDDGDALRLAVKLGIDVDQYSDWVETWKAGSDSFISVNYNGDPCAATRRAIVRAAAAIGSAM